jgi:hypothetical protein
MQKSKLIKVIFKINDSLNNFNILSFTRIWDNRVCDLMVQTCFYRLCIFTIFFRIFNVVNIHNYKQSIYLGY